VDLDEPGRCLKWRPKLERIDVLPAWKKVWNQARTDIETCLEIWGVAGKEGRGQPLSEREGDRSTDGKWPEEE